MADMIGLLRFGMPVAPVQPVANYEPPPSREVAAIGEGQATAGGGQTNARYTALPRPVVLPQFAQANAQDGAGSDAPLAGTSLLRTPEPLDPNMLTGPPPTFEATLLELEAHLRLSLARIDATRNAQGLEPKPAPEPVGSSAQPGTPVKVGGDPSAAQGPGTLPAPVTEVARLALQSGMPLRPEGAARPAEPAQDRTPAPREAEGSEPPSAPAPAPRAGRAA